MIKNNDGAVLEIEGATIMRGQFRNFSGEPDRFNKLGGKRYFNVEIDDPEVAEQLKADGWRIKTWASREEGIEPKNYLKVHVGRFVQFVNMVSGNNVVELIDNRDPDSQDGLDILDKADIKYADLKISPRRNDDGIIDAYLKAAWVFIEEDPFANKYAHLMNKTDEDMLF